MKDLNLDSKSKHFEKLIDQIDQTGKITALIATIPSRKKALFSTLDSIYHQVDEIRIVFNGYETVPNWTASFPALVSFVDPTNQFTDSAKWEFVPEDGYVFTIDDDIIYPFDYVSTMIKKIEEYKRKAVMTVHGSFFQLPFVNFLESKRSFHFAYELKKDVRVPMIGTGTLAFHVDTIRPRLEDFLNPSRSDIWFSALCLKKQIPMICIKRQASWLRLLATNNETIWNLMVANKIFQNANSFYVKELIIPYINENIFSI